MGKHFDAAIVGTSLSALVCAALLSRRAFRVLVVPGSERPALYGYEGLPLARRPFTFLGASSPAWKRSIVELAQLQAFRRRLGQLDPMFQLLAPGLRLDAPPSLQLFSREVDRELPDARREIDALHTFLAATNAAFDAALEQDVVWPPGGFWERRDTERVLAGVPLLDAQSDPSPVAELPPTHPYRTLVRVPVWFASNLGERLSPLTVARLHGSWTRGVSALEGGECEVGEFLLKRIAAQGGEARLNARVSSVQQRGGRACGVVLDDDTSASIDFLVTDLSLFDLLPLVTDWEPPGKTIADVPRLVPVGHRFITSLLVRREGLPALLARESFLVPSLGRERDKRPIVHLHRFAGAPTGDDTALLVAETLLMEGDATHLRRAREAVVEVIESFLPFIHRHLLLVDSPHDGRPLWDFRSGTRRDVVRGDLRSSGAQVDAEPMQPQWRVEPTTFHELGGEPLRGALGSTFHVGRSVLPALGQEGELLAAWSAARIITKSDKKREKMRREMWAKIEE